MCGIAGIVWSSPQADATRMIERMTQALQHRGPDGSGAWTGEGCVLGHRRLSVIDLAGGSQPMQTERYVISFNGEIFNYRELRAALEARGAAFHTQSDTEVLLRAFEAWGADGLRRLRGQYAFIIWDQQERRLFAARDPVGEKPLYYAETSQGALLLASELKAILAAGMIRPQLDPVAVDAYLSLLYVPPDRTIYRNISVLPPGHFLEWQDGKTHLRRYWAPAYSTGTVTDLAEVRAELRRLLEQAVRRQMIADVPLGAFLSGGMDSSTVVGLMSQMSARPVKTFSVGFGKLIDELPFAREVSHRCATEHHELQTEIPLGEVVQQMAQVYDEPFADSSNVPTYLIAQFARQHVTVALSGDGGDELFGGYGWYPDLLVDEALPGGTFLRGLAGLRAGLDKLTGGRLDHGARARYRRMARRHRFPDLWDRHLQRSHYMLHERRTLWGNPDVDADTSLYATFRPGHQVTGIDRIVDLDLRMYLPGDILVKTDRATLAHGLEGRAPFLDLDLVEFVLSLPAELRTRPGKALLSESCADILPDSVRKRPKQGFGAPVQHWITTPAIQSMLHRVSAHSSPLAHVLPGTPSALPQLNPQQKWTLLCLGLWLEQHPDSL